MNTRSRFANTKNLLSRARNIFLTTFSILHARGAVGGSVAAVERFASKIRKKIISNEALHAPHIENIYKSCRQSNSPTLQLNPHPTPTHMCYAERAILS